MRAGSMSFGSLWLGRPLGRMENACIASHLQLGHSFTLFAYDTTIAVPKGTVVRDAAEIVPEAKVFRVEGSLAPFSDYFRYRMVASTGLCWTDMDRICLRPDWEFGSHVMGFNKGPMSLVSANLLMLPVGSRMARVLVERSEAVDTSSMRFNQMSSPLVDGVARRLGLLGKVQSSDRFMPFGTAAEIVEMARPLGFWRALSRLRMARSHSVHLCHHAMARNGIDSSRPSAGSLHARLLDMAEDGDVGSVFDRP